MKMRVLVLFFTPLLLAILFIFSESVLSQECDKPCSNMTCSPPYYGPCCHKRNIARVRQYTSQSSEYREFSRYFPSDLAVDGNTNSDFMNFTCTHTDDEDERDAWWMINLESTYNISEIKLYLRNKNPQKYNGLRVQVDSTECFCLNKTFSPGLTPADDQIQHIHCSPPIPGSHVSVTVDNGVLTLCEVQIFFCDPGWYGEECDRQCKCRNSTECDKTTGWCRERCLAGKYGDGCQCDCAESKYGLDCKETCGHCLEGAICDKTNGACHSGCFEGFLPPFCQDCTNETYGLDCSGTCGHCLGGTFCDKTNGTCHSGCEQGYIPPLCQVVKDDMVPMAGGVSAVILVVIIIIVVVIVIIRRRRLQRKPMMTDANSDRNQKDTSFIDISDPSVTTQVTQQPINTTNGLKAHSQHQKATKPKESLSWTQREQKTEKSATKTSANQEPEEVSAEETPEVGSTEPPVGGNEYYSVIPAPIPLSKLAHYIKDRMKGVGFENEFKLLPFGVLEDHHEGKKPENKKRNRFLELYPYDNSRVVLKPEVHGDWDYINASYINGYGGTTSFIAAQGPNPVTVDDFWRMIWQENVRMIVMVTKLKELTKKKCEQYWPEDKEMRDFGNIRVRHECSTVRRDYTIRTFKVNHAVHASKPREITQLQFTTWSDHDVPSAPALVSFWKHFRRLHQEQDSGPVVVHCSAGVGRTGTFIALNWLFDEAEREKKVNVFNCVNQMRKARMNMVQTASQYGFLHEVVLEAVQSKNTFYTLTEFKLKFGTGASFTDDQQSEIQRQFEKLNTMRKTFTDKQVSEAKLPENIDKNRNQNILPENNSKAYLATPVKGRTNYINAVVLPSHVRPSALIATQTPLPDTVVDFWRLVYDHDIVNIICLENFEIMYPIEDSPVEIGLFQICLDKEQIRKNSFTQTQISLTFMEEYEENRQITVYTPSCTRPSELLEFVNEMETRGVFRQGQLLVHCNNGSDLCGLFCGVLNIITRLRLDREVDIFLDIRELQTIRPSFIHSLDQYRFCFDTVKEYERLTRIYENV